MWQNPHLLLVQLSIQSLGAEEGNGGAGERERAGMELGMSLARSHIKAQEGRVHPVLKGRRHCAAEGVLTAHGANQLAEGNSSQARLETHQGTSDFLGQTAFCKAAGPVCVSSRLSCRVTEGVTKRTAWAKLQDSLEWPQHGAPGKSPPVTQRATDDTGTARARGSDAHPLRCTTRRTRTA